MLVERYIQKQIESVPQPILGLIQSSKDIKRLAKVQYVIFTSSELFTEPGTILQKVISTQDQTPQTMQQMLQIAASLSAKLPSSNRLKAIYQRAVRDQLPLREVESEELSHGGITGKIDKIWYLLGEAPCLRQEEIELGVAISTIAHQLQAEGLFPTYLAQRQPKRLLAILASKQKVAPEVGPCLARLQDIGLNSTVVTTTNAAQAQGIIQQLEGIELQITTSTKEKKLRLQTISESFPNSLFVGTPESIQLVSPNALRMVVSRAEVTGVPLRAIELLDVPLHLLAAQAIMTKTRRRFFWCRM